MAKKTESKVTPMEYLSTKGNPPMGFFKDEKELQKFYKACTTESLETWAQLDGIVYKACPESAAIHRMRVAMSLLYHYFPRNTKAKKESKYAVYSLEDLVNLASENDVPVEMTDDERILRMRLIMALRASKVIC